MIHNFRILFSSQKRLIVYLVLMVLATLVWYSATDITIMFGNYGSLHTWIDIMLSWIIILGFPLFLIAFWYKSTLFGKGATLTGKSSTGIIGGLIGTIISGASCCGATLAAYFGLMPLMAFLPYDGLELKLIGTLGLIYALHDILTHLEVCHIKQS